MKQLTLIIIFYLSPSKQKLNIEFMQPFYCFIFYRRHSCLFVVHQNYWICTSVSAFKHHLCLQSVCQMTMIKEDISVLHFYLIPFSLSAPILILPYKNVHPHVCLLDYLTQQYQYYYSDIVSPFMLVIGASSNHHISNIIWQFNRQSVGVTSGKTATLL